MKTCIICGNDLTGNQQKYCSSKCKQKGHYDSTKENCNSMYSQTRRALERKLYFVNNAGGKCINCGYDRNLGALEFHHRDASKKDFALNARKLSNTSMDKLQKEADKCDLLCSNCHKELHYPEMFVGIVESLLEN